MNRTRRVSGVVFNPDEVKGDGKGGDLNGTAKQHRRRSSSFAPTGENRVLKELPLLSETPMAKREGLFKQKLQLCCIMFNFDDPTSDTRSKEIKRDTLVELAEYVNTPVGQKIFTEALMPDIIEMVRTNLFRSLPSQPDDFDPEEDEPSMEPSWPHLQVVYEFYLRFIVSTEVNGKVAKKYVDLGLIREWIELFDAEDPRERDYVKTVLHRMYGKFMSYRSFIRKAISQVFYRFIYETGRHNGIGELLEILGSIINGFAIPLKKEHVHFLNRALIPLHKPHSVVMYHPQLSYCILQYIEKDPDTVIPVVRGLIKYWPWNTASKQVLFLNELEEILELCRGEQLNILQMEIFQLIAQCLASSHFQVAERSLYVLNAEQLSVHLFAVNRVSVFLPVIFKPLHIASSGHWNQTVESAAQSVIKMFMEMDRATYDACVRDLETKSEQERNARAASEARWKEITETASMV